jgi:hypothetical protein
VAAAAAATPEHLGAGAGGRASGLYVVLSDKQTRSFRSAFACADEIEKGGSRGLS